MVQHTRGLNTTQSFVVTQRRVSLDPRRSRVRFLPMVLFFFCKTAMSVVLFCSLRIQCSGSSVVFVFALVITLAVATILLPTSYSSVVAHCNLRESFLIVLKRKSYSDGLVFTPPFQPRCSFPYHYLEIVPSCAFTNTTLCASTNIATTVRIPPRSSKLYIRHLQSTVISPS